MQLALMQLAATWAKHDRAKAAEDTAAELAGFHNEEGKVVCHLLCCYLAPNPGDRLICTWRLLCGQERSLRSR